MDKSGERNAFNTAYGVNNSWSIIETEVPDFLCERFEEVILGVEVTQLWINETDARINRIDGYVMKLLDGGEFVHKDDNLSLTVDKVGVFSADGKVISKEVDAIIQHYPNTLEKLAMLNNAIAKKNARFKEYLLRSSVVDLVVDDASMIFSFKDFEEVLLPISLSNYRENIIQSPFREIHLLTISEEIESRVSIPLKVNLLLEDVIILEEIFLKEFENISICEDNDIFLLILASLLELGYSNLSTCNVDGYQGLAIGAYTLHWTSTGKVLRDCGTFPEAVKIVDSISKIVGDLIDTDLVQSICKKRKGFKAICPISRSSVES